MLKVYHGSTVTIDSPLVSVGRDNLDFGKGFYVTDLREQAAAWAQRMADRQRRGPVINVYSLDMEAVIRECRFLRFPEYNIEWLDFIAANRNGRRLWADYDVIEGGIADDRVADTVEAYIAGMMPAEIALGRLAQHKPNNQICILRQSVADRFLTFLHAE